MSDSRKGQGLASSIDELVKRHSPLQECRRHCVFGHARLEAPVATNVILKSEMNPLLGAP
jgi:hypothetical protein